VNHGGGTMIRAGNSENEKWQVSSEEEACNERIALIWKPSSASSHFACEQDYSTDKKIIYHKTVTSQVCIGLEKYHGVCNLH